MKRAAIIAGAVVAGWAVGVAACVAWIIFGWDDGPEFPY